MIRFHDIFAQCPRPVDTVTPARFALAVCSPQLARNARTYEVTMANGTRSADQRRARVVPPVATTDGVHFDRHPTPEERAALIAYLRTL